MSYESELKKGNFMIPECTKCKKIVWPPSKFCNMCFNKTILREGKNQGKIIEYSKHQGKYFCLAEFENKIRIIGEINSGIPTENQMIKIENCGIKNSSYFFKFILD